MTRRTKTLSGASVITAVLLLGCASGFAQSPVNQWVLSPENIDITTVKDLAGNEDGLLHGRMVPSQNPPALYFDGTDTYIELAGKDEAKTLPTGNLTAEAWVAVNSPAEWGGIVGCLQDNGSFEKGWVLGYNNDKFNFALSTGGDLTYLNASTSFETGRWYHVVGTYNGSRMRIYVNGTERGSNSNRRGSIDYSPATFVIGCYLDDNEFYPLEGFISEVRLYNRALSSQQVRNRYNSTKGKHAARPKPPVVLTNRELSAGPYLAFASPSEAVVRWETAKPMPTRLAYGTTPTLQNRINLPKKTRQHEAVIPRIQPGTAYHYSVGVEQDGQTRWLAPATGESDFNYSRPDITAVESPYAEDERMRKSRAAAEAILAATGIRKGYAIDYGCGEGRLAFALAKRTELTVIGVTADAGEAARARAALRRARIYGTRVTIQHRPLAKLGHTDSMFNLAVSSELLHNGKLPGERAELLRVLRPSGGALALGGLPQSGLAKLISDSALARGTTAEASGELLLARRKALDGAGEWSHTYGSAAQTANSGDKIVNGGKMALQWFGKPGARGMIDRQGRNPPPLTSNGFLYVQGDNRIWGQDAFNGTILWNYEFPSELRRVNTPRDGSNMCADDSSLFVAMRDRAYRFDGRTGRLLRSFPVISADAANWGYIANDGEPAVRRQHQARLGVHEIQGHAVLVRLERHAGHGQGLQRQFVRDRQADRPQKMGVPRRQDHQHHDRDRRRAGVLRRVELIEPPERADQPHRLEQPVVEPATRRAQLTDRRKGLEQIDHRQQVALPGRVLPRAGQGPADSQLQHQPVLCGRLLHPQRQQGVVEEPLVEPQPSWRAHVSSGDRG